MKLRYFFLALALVVITVVSIAGYRGEHFTKPPFEIFPDMNYQDKVKDQQPSAFFADGSASRAPIPGTVAEEMPTVNDYWATGKWDDTHWGDGIPVHEGVDDGRPLQVDATNMARGRERYNISCAVCHGAAGDGKGITSLYGLNGAASYHTDRLRQETDGELFYTITNGKGQMFGYGYNIAIDDRWRIVMYIRALQRSQNAAVQDASPDDQKQLQEKAKPAVTPASNTSTDTTLQRHFSFDVGYQFASPSEALQILQFNLSANTKPVTGPLKIDYGAPCKFTPGESAVRGTNRTNMTDVTERAVNLTKAKI